MRPENLMLEIFSSWASLASHFIGECYDEAKEFLNKNYKGIDPYVRGVQAQLFTDCHLTSESALILVKSGKEWDADILVRAVLEGTIKYAFLMLGTPEEVRKKTHEYWEVLPNYESIRRHEKAKAMLANTETPDSIHLRPFKDLILTDEQIEKLRNGSNRAERTALDRKWSFNEIAVHFHKSGNPELKDFINLAHGYTISSHLLHKDGTGVSMVSERYQRSEENQNALILSHSAKIVSNICSFSILRSARLLKYCGILTSNLSEIRARYDDLLFKELEKAYKHFHDTEYNPLLENPRQIT